MCYDGSSPDPPNRQHLPLSHSDLSIGLNTNTWSAAVCFHVDEQKDKASSSRKIGKLTYACDLSGEKSGEAGFQWRRQLKGLIRRFFCAARLFNTIMFSAAWVGEIEFPPSHSLFLILLVEHFLQKFIAFKNICSFDCFHRLGSFGDFRSGWGWFMRKVRLPALF